MFGVWLASDCGAWLEQPANVADEEDVMNFCAEVLERHGAPDLLLNNAALINHNNPIWVTVVPGGRLALYSKR